MSEPFLGELKCVGWGFANRGWANCDGQLLPISQYSALFSLFGTMYGGDGRTTFGVPGLRGRVPIHTGTGPGLTPRQQGAKGGAETVVLNITEIPSHNHNLVNGTQSNQAQVAINTVEGAGNQTTPDFHVLAGGGGMRYSDAATNGALNRSTAATISGQTSLNGGSRDHQNMQPFQVLRWLVALQGVYPSRS